MVQSKKRQFYNKESETLSQICKYKQNEFWRRWKKLKGSKQNFDHVKIESFTDYYRSTSNSELDPTFDEKFMSDLSKAILDYNDMTKP